MGGGLDAEVREALRRGVALFNEGRFWEAHEVLERVWLRDEPPRRRFVHGLIKVAAGYHHLGRGNYRSMHRLLVAGRGLLLPFAPSYLGLDVGGLLAAIADHAAWARTAAGGGSGPPVVPPRIVLREPPEA